MRTRILPGPDVHLQFLSGYGPDDLGIHKRLKLMQAIEDRFQWHPVGPVASDACVDNTHHATDDGVLSAHCHPTAQESPETIANSELPRSPPHRIAFTPLRRCAGEVMRGPRLLSLSGAETTPSYPLIWVRN